MESPVLLRHKEDGVLGNGETSGSGEHKQGRKTNLVKLGTRTRSSEVEVDRSTITGQKAQECLTRPVGQHEKKGVDHKTQSKLLGRD